MLSILYKALVAFGADSKLVRTSVLLLPEPLNVQVQQVVTRESESGESD